MAHEPDIFPQVPERVSLTISGHTHGGQVDLPFFGRLVVPSAYGQRYAYGHVVENDRHLIVSGGLGCSVLPVRLRRSAGDRAHRDRRSRKRLRRLAAPAIVSGPACCYLDAMKSAISHQGWTGRARGRRLRGSFDFAAIADRERMPWRFLARHFAVDGLMPPDFAGRHAGQVDRSARLRARIELPTSRNLSHDRRQDAL